MATAGGGRVAASERRSRATSTAVRSSCDAMGGAASRSSARGRCSRRPKRRLAVAGRFPSTGRRTSCGEPPGGARPWSCAVTRLPLARSGRDAAVRCFAIFPPSFPLAYKRSSDSLWWRSGIARQRVLGRQSLWRAAKPIQAPHLLRPHRPLRATRASPSPYAGAQAGQGLATESAASSPLQRPGGGLRSGRSEPRSGSRFSASSPV